MQAGMKGKHMKQFTGSCLCRQVSYRIEGVLRQVMACHCSQCRKTSGHYVAATQTDTKRLRITGNVTWYRSSAHARRGFCAVCGSNLFWQSGDRERTSVFAGTLDGQTGLRITQQIHVESKGDYYDLPDVPVVQDASAESRRVNTSFQAGEIQEMSDSR